MYVVINLKRMSLRIIFLVLMIWVLWTGISKGWDGFWRWLYPVDYESYVMESSQEYRIDPYLIFAMVRVESKFDPMANSPKGARGLLQLMPDTANWIAGKNNKDDFNQELLYDPQINIDMGTWYLSNLREEFGDNVILILAAYNGGRGNVQKWLGEEGWRPEQERIKDIPFPETREYVWRVLKSYYRYHKIYGDKQ